MKVRDIEKEHDNGNGLSNKMWKKMSFDWLGKLEKKRRMFPLRTFPIGQHFYAKKAD